MQAAITHPYWGTITDSRRSGYISDIKFSHPFFGDKSFPVYLGHHDITNTPNHIREFPDQYYKPIHSILGENNSLLDEFATTYSDFIANIELRIETLKHKLYLQFMDHLSKQLSFIFEAPPVIQSEEEHNEHIRNLAEIRVLKGGEIKLALYYNLFPAPVFTTSFINGILEDL